MLYKSPILVFLLITIFFFQISYAQQLGGNRPSTKWKQIKTSAARIIFPAGLDSQATAVASQINYIAERKEFSLGNKIKQVPVVLQNQPVVSNGYVALGPFRSEFYMAPPASNLNLGSLPWGRTLAIHEYRHVQQYNNFKVGAAAVGSVIFGQQTQALVNALIIPDWFFEGDAVFNETVNTAQGRGRLPYFLNEFKVLNSITKKPGYMQMRNGSLRYQYPNHYQLGYLLTAYGYEHYGADFWMHVTNDANNLKGFFYPFQKAVKRNAGIDYKTFVKAALKDYSADANVLAKGVEDPVVATTMESAKERITKRARFVENYLQPQVINTDSIIWLKRSTKAIAAFYLKTGTKEKKITTRWIGNDDFYTYNNGRIIYTTTGVNPRWSSEEYNDVVVYNMHTKKTQQLSRRKRYFSPSINTAGTTIVVVENTIEGESKLQLLDAATGAIQRTVGFPESLQTNIEGKGIFTYPSFYGDSNIVAALRFANGQMAIGYFSLRDNTSILLTPLSYQVYSALQIKDGYLYTNASLDGTDRIIRIHLSALDDKSDLENASDFGRNAGNVDQLQQAAMTYNPIVANNKLWASKFTINGLKPVEMELSAADWEPVTLSWSSLPTEYAILNETPHASLKIPRGAPVFPTEQFPAVRYAKSTGLFNFHSWQPLYSDQEIGLALIGQNVLNTFQSEVFYRYQRNDKSHSAGFSAIYGGLFPYIKGSMEYTMDRSEQSIQNNLRWNELTVSGGIEVPLKFNKGKYYRNLKLRSSVNNQSIFIINKQSAYRNSNFNYLSTGFSYIAQMPSTSQQIYPRFAHSFTFNWRRAFTEFSATQVLGAADLYLPGLFATHNLVLNAAFQEHDNNRNYRFSNNFPTARGYTDYNFQRMYKLGANYHLPLLYPEWGFSNLVYFLRIRANLFVDMANISDQFRTNNNSLIPLSFDQRSTGAEVFFDTKWWNQLPVSFGIRYSRLLNKDLFGRDQNQFEFIMPIDLF